MSIRKPKIVRYESCMTLNQKVNNIRKSHYTLLEQKFVLKQMSVFRVSAFNFLEN